ncbi:hypothetical protein B0H65DRAFT_446930 [Neurospora tetraspora]|uniref:Uncharacterized protein n=1 Tax=Neurospora tetraspora TaxID=94610 RepID=A0AAE0J0Y7_9PEZI|nr:hypothetical protein B0H65DRAFT_446930 [Neurospora tetraspora]
MPGRNDEGWEMDDPNAPTQVGPDAPDPPSDPAVLRKEALDAMSNGQHYRKAPEWYKTVFEIICEEPEEGEPEDNEPTSSQVDWIEHLNNLGRHDPGKWIGYALGVLSKLNSETINSCFKSCGEVLGTSGQRDKWLEWHLKMWISVVAPLLRIYEVEDEIVNSLVEFCRQAGFEHMDDDWLEIQTRCIKALLEEMRWPSLDGVPKPSPTYVMVGYKEAREEPVSAITRALHGNPPSGGSMGMMGGDAAMNAFRDRFAGGRQGQGH